MLPGKHTNQHAVVIGAGLNGLLAARVLAEQFSLVTVVTRGSLSQTAPPPANIWQAIPQHILSLQGQRDLERLFPGIKAELMAAGAPGIDWMADVPLRLPGGWGPRFHSDLSTRSATINLLEHIIRRRLLEYSRGCVEFLENQPIDGIHPAGLLLPGSVLQADVIVDAAGRDSQAVDWLGKAGYELPQQSRTPAQGGIAARLYRRPHGLNPGWRGLIMLAGDRGRGGVLLPVEDGGWLVMLVGHEGDEPAGDDTGFLNFASGLSPMGEALRLALPLTPVFRTREAESSLWHYDRLSRWPDTFLTTGAVISSPVLGLDLTLATTAAFILRETLSDQRRRYPQGELKGLGGRFQKRLARTHAPVWQMMALYQSQAQLSQRMTQAGRWYHDRVLAAAAHDPYVYQTVIEAAGLMTPVHRLFRPAFIRRVLAGRTPSHAMAADPPILQADQPHKTITQEVMPVAAPEEP